MSDTLDQLLSCVVERKGFRVQGTDAEALFAKRGEEALLVAWKTAAAVSADDAKLFLAALEQVRAGAGIVAAPIGIDAAAKDLLAAAKSVEVWGESRLVVEIGDAMLKNALDPASAQPPAMVPAAPAPAAAPAARPATKFPSLVSAAVNAAGGSGGSGVAYFMPNRKKEQPADMQATIPQHRGGALGYAWGGSTGGGMSNPGIAQVRSGRNPRLKTDQWGNLIPPEKAAAQAAAPAAPMPTSRVMDADSEAYEILPSKKAKPTAAVKEAAAAPACTTLKLNVDKDEALAKTKGGTIKLALVPHVAFTYDLEMSRPGMTEAITGRGAVLVNSLSGELRPIDTLDFAPAEPTEARKDLEKLTAVDVYDKVKSHVTKSFARTLNVEREVGGNTVMETLKLSPDPEEMGLEHRGIVHLPVWEITTSTGVTKVDGHTGALL